MNKNLIRGAFNIRWVILFCERQAVFDWAGSMYFLVVLGAFCCCAVSRHQFKKHAGVTTANVQAVMAGALYTKVFALIFSLLDTNLLLFFFAKT